MKSKAWTEKFMQGVFLIAACTSVLAVALICIFLFANGVPAIREIGFVKFITGELWRPNNNLFGIFPMIIGSLYVTAGAIVFGVPIGILTSVFMAMYCPKNIQTAESSNRAVGRNSFRCVWILRSGRTGANGTGVRKNIKTDGNRGKSRRRKRTSHYVDHSGNDDPADNHRNHRECDPRCADPLL